ncbi:Protein kinase domain protein [Aspergillus sclerotialis]|uniref:non-specific serine/threonine protein kinase n=1 Tax=Aspergillus sclerotialis TaxID=2070753 RepID=A0A3A2ZKB9_9EURO|nr:Protein kinase domain protein [Aspergillus sclerotialis]
MKSFNVRRQLILSDSVPLFSTTSHLRRLSSESPPFSGRNNAAIHLKTGTFAPSETPKDCAPVEYVPLEDVENPKHYCPGGYHPISIGDQLTERYQVIHKLGFGSYSTTWLARDRNTKKYVAIKVAIAEADIPESKILNSLLRSQPSDEGLPGKDLIPRVLDMFSFNGPNGRHSCLVAEPGMMTLAEAKDASVNRLFKLPVAKAVAAKVIQAVSFLHHRGGPWRYVFLSLELLIIPD